MCLVRCTHKWPCYILSQITARVLAWCFFLGSYLCLKGQRQGVHTCQSEEKELGTNQMHMIKMWISCFVLTYMKRDWFIYLLFFQPAVLDNLLTSMKFVFHGMGVLRINLANSKNKVWTQLFSFCCRIVYLFITHS